ncbi:MAG: hypothetical protein ACE5JU_08750 [Candidatus Binatia bacterium]
MLKGIEDLKGKHVEVGLANQTLHGVLEEVVAEAPTFLVLEEENLQKVFINLQHVVTLRAVEAFKEGWERDDYY